MTPEPMIRIGGSSSGSNASTLFEALPPRCRARVEGLATEGDAS
jgi:hypothetical protein